MEVENQETNHNLFYVSTRLLQDYKNITSVRTQLLFKIVLLKFRSCNPPEIKYNKIQRLYQHYYNPVRSISLVLRFKPQNMNIGLNRTNRKENREWSICHEGIILQQEENEKSVNLLSMNVILYFLLVINLSQGYQQVSDSSKKQMKIGKESSLNAIPDIFTYFYLQEFHFFFYILII